MSTTFIKQVLEAEKGKFLTNLRNNNAYPRLLHDVERAYQTLERELTSTQEHAPLYITDVSQDDVFRIFPSLSIDTRSQSAVWALGEEEMFEVPSHLEECISQILDDFSLFNNPGSSPHSPVDIRSRLDNILVSAVARELKVAGYSGWDSENRRWPTAPLTLQYEKYLQYNINYEDRKRVLQGSCDYSLWRGLEHTGDELEVHGIGVNFIVCVAKKKNFASVVEASCLAFMGMVHDIRKRAGMRDSTVYGLASDSSLFSVLSIDNESRVSKQGLFWKYSATEIYSLLRMIFRRAALLAMNATDPSAIPIPADPSIPERLGYSICEREDILKDSRDEEMEV